MDSLQPGGRGLPVAHPGRQAVAGHRAGDAVTLALVATEMDQHAAVLHRLDALGDDLAAEGVGQADNAVDDGQVVRVFEHVMDEGAVDLQRLHGQLLEVGEGRIAGAEIVDGELHAKLAAFGDALRNLRQILQGGGFQNLDLQLPGRYRRVAGENLLQAGQEILPLQVVGVDVHADRQLQVVGQPAFHLAQRGLHDVFTQVALHAVLLEQGEEVVRREQAFFRMLPAQQRLSAENMPGPHVGLGLVKEHEFTVGQRPLQFILAGAQRAGLAVAGLAEELEAMATGLLGGIHRLVGMAEQGVGVEAVGRVQRDADAGGDLHLLVLDGEGGIEHVGQAVQGLLAFGEAGQFADQQHELVAAQAADRVVLAQALGQAAGDLDQQAVAGGVAPAVVDRLEIVEIEIAHGQQVAAPVGLGDGLLQAVGEQQPVGQAGQRIVVGHLFQLFLVVLQGGDVGEQADEMGDAAVAVADRRNAGALGVGRAVLALVPDFAAPGAGREQGLPHVFVEILLLAAGAEKAGRLADQLGLAVAGDAADAVVGPDNMAARVGDQDAFLGVGKNAAGQAQRGFVVVQHAVAAQGGPQGGEEQEQHGRRGAEQADAVAGDEVVPGDVMAGVGAEARLAE